MSFLTTQTEEMLAAEQLLSGINTNLAAQNAGAASATTVIAPAAADPVSAQQAAIFSSYGTQYQALAAQAQAQLEQYASTLGISSNAYGDTEAVNASQAVLSNAASPLAAAAATPSNTPLDYLSYLLGSTGNGTNPNMLGGIFGLSSNGANILNIGAGNWASAGSDLLGMAGGGLLDTSGDAAGAGLAADVASSPGLGATGAAAGGITGMGAVSAVPVASMGSATMVNNLAVPPSWAGAPAPAVTPVSA
ncbi:PE family protein, partial [Mycobacterium senriense]